MDLSWAPGEKYGYHVAAILWLAARNPVPRDVIFDLSCRLRPLVLHRIQQWAENPRLLALLGVAPDSVRALANVRWFVDNLHGSFHNAKCRYEFMLRYQEDTGTNRGGSCSA